MSVKQALLALLEQEPMYGYQLRTEFEARTGSAWPLNVGQVYTTLTRLERDGLVEPAGADTYVVSRLGGTSMTARLHVETSAHPGESMTLAFDLGKVSYFSPESGQRLN